MTQPNTEHPQPERGWREHAVCRDVDPELFFPAAETGPVLDAQVTAAKAVCAGCPVRAQCLTEALARIPYGIAGGLTEHERRRLRMTSPGRPAKPRKVQPAGSDGALTRRERADVGHELLAAGRAPDQVASACRVSVRTVERWAARTRTSTSTTAQHGMGERSRGGNRAPLQISTAHDTPGRDTSTGRSTIVVGTIYCGPFTAEINEGTRYGHEGYAVQVLHDGTESGHFVLGSFREYRAGCDCGWRAATVHPPTDAGEDAALDQWHGEHLNPLIRAVAAKRVVPATALLDLIAELRRTSISANALQPDGRLTEREAGRFDVIEVLESRLEDIAVEQADRPDGPARRPTGGAW